MSQDFEEDEEELSEEEENLIVDRMRSEAIKFAAISKPILEEIDARIKVLVELSEKTGIPFDLHEDTYVPSTMIDLYPINSDSLNDIMGEYATWFGMDYDSYGWMNSSSGC